MSVPKRKRNQSKIEFENTYFKVFDDAVTLTTYHFGACEQCYSDNKLLFDTTARQVMFLVKKLLYHIKIANSIYPQCMAEYEERRIHQDKAIGICFDLLAEYQLIMRKARIPENKYVTFIQNLEHEINSIKSWRQSDNRFKKILG